MTRKAPEIIEVSSQQMQELRDRASSNMLRDEDTELMGRIFDSYIHLFQIVGDKNTTITRLRKLLFGASTEKTNKLTDEDDTPQEPSANDGQTVDNDLSNAEGGGLPDSSDGATTKDAPPPGHGRYSADDYPGAEQVDILHAQLCKGDNCPVCQRGTLYEKAPSLFVRFIGQAPLQATAYRLQRLRCNLCGKVFTASPPDEMGQQKYDHTVASMIGLLKYGSGLPFNRVQRLQGEFQDSSRSLNAMGNCQGCGLADGYRLPRVDPASRSRRGAL